MTVDEAIENLRQFPEWMVLTDTAGSEVEQFVEHWGTVIVAVRT